MYKVSNKKILFGDAFEVVALWTTFGGLGGGGVEVVELTFYLTIPTRKNT